MATVLMTEPELDEAILQTTVGTRDSWAPIEIDTHGSSELCGTSLGRPFWGRLILISWQGTEYGVGTTDEAYRVYEVEQDLHGTGVCYGDSRMELLEEAARRGDRDTFMLLAKGDWSYARPESSLRIVELAIALGFSSLAADFAAVAARTFPADQRAQSVARVLAPPTFSEAETSIPQRLVESRQWLRENAHRFRGKWVAVRDGRLLGAADHLRDLKPLIDLDPVSTVLEEVA